MKNPSRATAFSVSFETYMLRDPEASREDEGDAVVDVIEHISGVVPNTVSREAASQAVSRMFQKFPTYDTLMGSDEKLLNILRSIDGLFETESGWSPFELTISPGRPMRFVISHKPHLKGFCPICTSEIKSHLKPIRLTVEKRTFSPFSVVGGPDHHNPLLMEGVFNAGDTVYVLKWVSDVPVSYFDVVHRTWIRGSFGETAKTSHVQVDFKVRYKEDETIEAVSVRDIKGRVIRAVCATCVRSDPEAGQTSGTLVIGAHPHYAGLVEVETLRSILQIQTEE